MRIVPLLAASLLLPACIIVPPQNVCVVPTPAVGTGTTGSPAPGPGTSAAPVGGVSVGGGATVTTSPTPAAVASGGLAVTPGSLNLTALGPAATPLQAQAGASFRSDNPAIATVDANGAVTGVGNGSTTITVSLGGLTTRIPVTVQQQATTLRVTTTLPGDPRTVALVPGTPVKVTASATDANGKPVAGVTFRYDPDAGTTADAVLVDNAGNVQLQAPPLTKASGTIRVVAPNGQASTDADSIRITIGL